MIDTHCHLFPTSDDEPDYWNDFLRMTTAAVNEGIHDIFATPNHGLSNPINNAHTIAALVRKMNDLLRSEGLPLTIHAGQEFHFHDGYESEFQAGALKTMGSSRYILIRLPASRTPAKLSSCLRFLRQKGRRAIITLPELHIPYLKKPDLMEELRLGGVLFQLAAPSLLGYYGPDVERAAWQMIRNRQIHLLGSNLHVRGPRGFLLQDAYARITEEMGPEMTDFLMMNAGKLLQGDAVITGSFTVSSAGPPEEWHRIDLALLGKKGRMKDRLYL